MTNTEAGAKARLSRVRARMRECAWDAVCVRDEANLRWLTGAAGVFDFTGEYPHAAFITHESCYLHTDSRYYNSFVEHIPDANIWQLDQDGDDIPKWVVLRARETHTRVLAVEDDMQISFFRGIERAAEDLSVVLDLPCMHDDIQLMRAVKDAEELGLMRQAQAITDAAFEHMLSFIRPGMTEKEIRLELESYMFAHGADALAFSSIVASGPNAANPHAIPTDRKVCEGEFVLMDYGASYHDYRSDMTRTVALGEPGTRQREIYDLVRRCHEECAAAVSAGVDGHDIHLLSQKIIGDAGYGDCYGHGLGHGVGIDIHEKPTFGRVSNIVGEGAVITVEPGVYLPGEFGVRLEDCGLVTRTGYEPFTRSPHELQIIPC